MFLLRSAFWLTIGFLLVAPHGTDFGAAATALKDQAVEASLEAGQQLIVSRRSRRADRLPDLSAIRVHAIRSTYPCRIAGGPDRSSPTETGRMG